MNSSENWEFGLESILLIFLAFLIENLNRFKFLSFGLVGRVSDENGGGNAHSHLSNGNSGQSLDLNRIGR